MGKDLVGGLVLRLRSGRGEMLMESSPHPERSRRIASSPPFPRFSLARSSRVYAWMRMSVIKTAIDPRSDAFRSNAESLRAQVADLGDKVAAIRQGGGAGAREKHLARGKLLPRDRIRTLLDPGAPFLELSQLAAYCMDFRELSRARDIHRIS